MKTLSACFFVAILSGLLAGNRLAADTITIANLPDPNDIDTRHKLKEERRKLIVLSSATAA
jgi:hypothetical protein